MVGIIKKGKLYISKNAVIKDLDSFYIFNNTGNAANPCIILKKITNKKTSDVEVIGGIKELINYMINNDENMFLINGFGRADIARIYKLYLEEAMELKRDIIDTNNKKIKRLKNDNEK